MKRGAVAGVIGMAVLVCAGCTRDAEPARPTGSQPFESDLPPVVIPQEPGERAEAVQLTTPERKVCDALSRTASTSLDVTASGLVLHIQPADGLRAEALDAARELVRALHAPSEYGRPGDRSGCGIAELGRETSMAEVREQDPTSAFEVHVAAWPGREEVLRGRARVLVGALG